MMRPTINAFKIMALCTAFAGLMAGCSTTQRNTQSPRTSVEQLLISEAVIRSLPRQPESPLPIPQGSNVILNTSGLTTNQALLQQVLTGWLGQQGYLVQKDEKNATHRIDVIVGALGTELGGTFVGMPPLQSQFIPFALPELSLYKSQHQTGYVKFHMNIFEIPAGRFAGSTPAFLADSYFNKYTVLFIISFTSTDLVSPPQLGTFLRKSINTPETQGEDMTKAGSGK
jgi:hypothetical protein